MTTNPELGKSNREVHRIAAEEIKVNTVEKAIDLQLVSKLGVMPYITTHQKRDITVFEDVFAMSVERVLALLA